MNDYETVLVERHDSIAVVSLNRPDSLNSFNGALRRELLLCTDGFAELATPDGTALGYSGATEAFREAAIGTPSEIIRTLLATADSWSRGAPQEDDITFVVLQARDHGAG